ncbi:hypothetical protein SRHO_G00086920 [Serrasalmus rhombeus]
MRQLMRPSFVCSGNSGMYTSESRSSADLGEFGRVFFFPGRERTASISAVNAVTRCWDLAALDRSSSGEIHHLLVRIGQDNIS